MFDLFHSRRKDKIIAEIAEENSRKLKEAAQISKKLRDELRKNGVTLQLFIATGGGHRK